MCDKTHKFWRAAEQASAEVARWPEWRRAGYMAATRGRFQKVSIMVKGEENVSKLDELLGDMQQKMSLLLKQ